MHHVKTLVALTALMAIGAVSAAPTRITPVSQGPNPQIRSTIYFHADNPAWGANHVGVLEYVVRSTAPAGTFAAFCLEPYDHLTLPWTYDNAGVFTPMVASSLSRLFTGANWVSSNSSNDGVTTNAQKIGLGLAVWDIFRDGGTLDFTAGTMRVTDDGVGGAALSFAMKAYAKGNTSLVPDLRRLTDPLKQDLVIAVPEPTTYALMLAGLVGIGFVARRRNMN